jgi:hypothetical protein
VKRSMADSSNAQGQVKKDNEQLMLSNWWFGYCGVLSADGQELPPRGSQANSAGRPRVAFRAVANIPSASSRLVKSPLHDKNATNSSNYS